jgi:hypothetical protein
MNGVNSNWLAKLAPEHAPAAQGWWPPAPGWWIVAVLIALMFVAVFFWWRNPIRLQRAAALRELQQLKADHDHAVVDTVVVAQSIQQLLRRYALTRFGHEHVAKMSGAAWLQFIGNHGGAELAGEYGRSLLSSAFGGEIRDHREHWLAGATSFVRLADRSRTQGARS